MLVGAGCSKGRRGHFRSLKSERFGEGFKQENIVAMTEVSPGKLRELFGGKEPRGFGDNSQGERRPALNSEAGAE